MTERFGIAVNLKRVAPSQYRNFNFNSMCVFNGKPLAADSGGIFSLEDAEKDNGVNINAVVEFPTSDFGELRAKRFRKMYAGYETSGGLKFTATVDGRLATTYTLSAERTGQLQHRGILPMTRDAKGVYWIFKFENISGADFSLDHLEGIPIFLTRGRR